MLQYLKKLKNRLQVLKIEENPFKSEEKNNKDSLTRNKTIAYLKDLKYLDYRIISDEERQAANDEMKEQLTDNQVEDNANDITEESKASLAELKEAMIEITQHFVKYIITKDENNYLKLRGFKKLEELKNALEGELDPLLQKYQADMKLLIKNRNAMIKFSLEKLANAEHQAEEISIEKINQYQKMLKQKYREIERQRSKEDQLFDGTPHEKELLIKLVDLKNELLEVEIKLQSALRQAIDEFKQFESTKNREMTDLTSKFSEEATLCFQDQFNNKLEEEFKTEKAQRLENNTELNDDDYMESLKEEFVKEGNRATYELFLEEDDDELKETVSGFKENIDKEIREAETLISNNIKNAINNLEKEINDKQLARNRSIVLEILDTINSFEAGIRQKFTAWRNAD